MKNLREALKQKNKVIIGTERTLKSLKQGKLSNVYISKNCPKDILSDIEHYSKIHEVNVIKLKVSNEELGVVCKKPYPISILGF